jgi:FOG: GGDEF domain
MARIELKNFSSYNKEHGWSEGDLFLKEFAQFIKARFAQGMVFRYHGDNFIVLFEEQDVHVRKEEIEMFERFAKTRVRFALSVYDLTKELPEL